jgi:large subunit ribosomal protein LP1
VHKQKEMASKQELAIIYAALALEDEGVPINADKINKMLQAAGVQVEPFWPGLYVKALEGVKISVSFS